MKEDNKQDLGVEALKHSLGLSQPILLDCNSNGVIEEIDYENHNRSKIGNGISSVNGNKRVFAEGIAGIEQMRNVSLKNDLIS